jgi:hypothetical protein
MTALVVGLTVAVALLGVLVTGLLRAHADVLRALHQLGVNLDPARPDNDGTVSSVPPPGVRPTPARPADTAVIDLTGATPSGDAVGVAVVDVRHDTLLAFLSSGCTTCRTFWDAFRTGPPDVPGGARLIIVTRGAEAESPGALSALTGRTEVVMSSEAWESYDVPYAPYFVYVSGPAGRVVGEGVASNWDQVRSLVAGAVADGTTSPAAKPRSRADRERDSDVDRQLRAAGIRPGDPRLYPTSMHGPSGS